MTLCVRCKGPTRVEFNSSFQRREKNQQSRQQNTKIDFLFKSIQLLLEDSLLGHVYGSVFPPFFAQKKNFFFFLFLFLNLTKTLWPAYIRKRNLLFEKEFPKTIRVPCSSTRVLPKVYSTTSIVGHQIKIEPFSTKILFSSAVAVFGFLWVCVCKTKACRPA